MKRRFIGNATSTPIVEMTTVPDHQLPPRHDGGGDHHVCRHARCDRRDHVTGRRRYGLRAVVLENCQVVDHSRSRHEPEHREGEDDGRETDADGDSSLASDVKGRRRQHAAEEEAGDRGADRELRHVAAVHVVMPPAILLETRPGGDLLLVQLLDGHEPGCREVKDQR
jgi:hypothetical protein